MFDFPAITYHDIVYYISSFGNYKDGSYLFITNCLEIEYDTIKINLSLVNNEIQVPK